MGELGVRRQTKPYAIETRRTVSWIEWGMMRPERIAELRLYGLVRHLLNLRLMLREKDEKARIDFERSFTWKRLGADAIEAERVAQRIGFGFGNINDNKNLNLFFEVEAI